MNRIGRIAAVTAGLIVGGALFGGIAAVAALLIGAAVTGTEPGLLGAWLLGYVFAVGAFFGGVLFPTACWVLMRRVALWLALLGTVAGTLAGGLVGWLLPEGDLERGFEAVIGAVVGFLIASVLLYVLATREGPREAPRVSVH